MTRTQRKPRTQRDPAVMRAAVFACAAALAVVVSGFSRTIVAQQSRTRQHVQTLASEKFDGRMTGSPGERLAADYIVSELKRIGAKPVPGLNDYRLPFEFTAGSRDGGSQVSATWQTDAAGAGATADARALSF